MTSLRVHSGNFNLRCDPYKSFPRNNSIRWQRNYQKRSKMPRLCIANELVMNSTKGGAVSGNKAVDKEELVSGKVDQWIRESVKEIVSNIEEAPFLVQIYSDNEEQSSSASTSTKTKVIKENTCGDSWPLIKRRWEEGETSIPDGIAVIEELKPNKNSDLLPMPAESLRTTTPDIFNDQSCSSTKVWGIVIQERGVSCPACYILKTSRVRSVSGICTHFCLFRTECFAEYADTQLKKLWLL